jgi:uncharacterized protein YabN with tetrapyrrole methylase and pyrophosphatase domain
MIARCRSGTIDGKRRRTNVTDQTLGNDLRPIDIYVCGTGMRIPGHLTVETMGVLQGCHRIFSIMPQDVKNLLPSPLSERFEHLWSLYRPREFGQWTYESILDSVLDAAKEQPPVALLTQGNPIILEPITQALLARAREEDLTIEIRPGVSAIDTILVELQIDIASGIQIFNASVVVLDEKEIRPDLPCLLIQPASTAVSGETVQLGHQGAFGRTLRDYLLRFYPADHEVACVIPSISIGSRTRIDRFPLAQFGDRDEALATGASFYLSAAPRYRIEPKAFDSGLFLPDLLRYALRKDGFHA